MFSIKQEIVQIFCELDMAKEVVKNCLNIIYDKTIERCDEK